MGRHRRATPTPPPSASAAVPPDGARHRAGRRRGAAPVRTGLLGVSAALAVGAVAVSSGLVPGPGGNYTVGDPDGRTDRADGSGSLTTQGSGSRNGSASPSTPDSKSPDGGPSGRPGSSASPGHDGAGDKPSERTPASPSDSPSTPSGTPTDGDGGRQDTERDGADTGDAGHGTPTSEASPKSTASGPGDGGSGSHQGVEAQVLKLVNAERAQVGCSPLTADPGLAEFAGDYSADMAARGFFSHTTPDGQSPWDRAEAAGVGNLGGENIARGQRTAEAVMKSWMNSPGHRKNILNCDFRTMGVGAHFAPGGPWWTQNFGY